MIVVDPMEISDTESEVVEESAVNMMAGKEVTVQPVHMAN